MFRYFTDEEVNELIKELETNRVEPLTIDLSKRNSRQLRDAYNVKPVTQH